MIVPLREAAEHTGCSVRTLYNLIASGAVARRKIVDDSRTYVDVEEVRQALGMLPARRRRPIAWRLP